MKLYALLVMYKTEETPQKLKGAFDVSSFSFFQRKSVEEFMNFTAKIMTERTQVGDRTSVTEGEYFCHVFVRPDCLVGVCLSDQEYPPRVAHTLLGKVLDDFTLTVISILLAHATAFSLLRMARQKRGKFKIVQTKNVQYQNSNLIFALGAPRSMDFRKRSCWIQRVIGNLHEEIPRSSPSGSYDENGERFG